MYREEFEPTERAAWELYADDGDDHIDPKLVKRDLAELEKAAKKAKDWTDAHIAHAGRERLDVTLTRGELDFAIDTLGVLMRRYDLLLRASRWLALVPEGIRLDLETLFGQPWIQQKGTGEGPPTRAP